MSTHESQSADQLSHGVVTRKYSDQLLARQFQELKEVFSKLCLDSRDGHPVVSGRLGFTVNHEGKDIKDVYCIEIYIPDEYPYVPPKVKETGYKIPQDDEHHVNKDGALCISSPLQVSEVFYQNRTLLTFVKELVVPYLFCHSFREKYGKWPYGELSHGTKGLLESYKELFSTTDDLVVLRLLKVLVDGGYKGHTLCPCWSGKKLRHCHGNTLLRIKDYPIDFSGEYSEIFELVKDQIDNVRLYIPDKILLKELRRKRAKRR